MLSAESYTPDELAWATRLAGRLRYIQATLAEAPAEERQEELESELRRWTRDVLPDRRKRYLAALQDHFPTFAEEAPRVEVKPQDTSPEAMVEALVRMAPNLPPQKVAEFGVRLQQAGYIGLKTSVAAEVDPPPEFLRHFPIPPGTRVDIRRLYRLATIFADFYVRLDNFAWPVWQQISPQTRIRRNADPRQEVRAQGLRYLQGDSEVSGPEIQSVVERTRQLIAGLLGGLAGAGRAFAARFSADYAPEAIMSHARADQHLSGSYFSPEEVRAWRKFRQIFDGMSEDIVEEKLHHALAQMAENLIRGTRTENESAL